jgi:uncharacterized protein
MATILPRFKYHPDPVATGAFKVSDAICECCGKARGYAYVADVYAIEDVESVCPWCIADGSLERKYDATLNDGHPLHLAGLPSKIIDEVTRRTPGYLSWQQDSWIVCCNDACEFHGDAPVDEIRALDEPGLAALSAESGFSIADLRDIVHHYQQGGSPAFYKFVCRHCSRVSYNGDCD